MDDLNRGRARAAGGRDYRCRDGQLTAAPSRPSGPETGESGTRLSWSFPRRALADYLIGRAAIHGVRRAHEMTEVAETLKSLGIEPMMSKAAAKRIAWAGSFGLKDKFGDTPPKSFHEVLEALKKAGKKKPKKRKAGKKKA